MRSNWALKGIAISLGWLFLLVAGIVALTTVGDAAKSTGVYVAVWLASTTLPGILMWRALARPTTVVQEIGFGSVLGIALLLLAWVPATLVHRPELMWVMPVGIILTLFAVPPLRRKLLSPRSPDLHTPIPWHAAMMIVSGVAFVRFYYFILDRWRLPPTPTSSIFQDAWYELSLTQSLRRTVGIDDPSAAGVPLHYHWFSNAHAAATQELSEVSAPEVVFHLWLVLMLLTFVFVTAAATERILQGPGESPARVHWWAGPLGALMATALPATMFLGAPRLPAIDNGFIASSTSGVLAIVLVLAFVGPALDLLHGRGGRGTWLLLTILIALGAGTKPSLLPVVACGGLLAGLAQWVRTRRFPLVAAVLTFAPLVVMAVAALAVVGSTGGSRLQLFQTLALDPGFVDAAGSAVGLPGHGGWLAPGLAHGSGHVWAVALGLFALYVLTELPRLIGLASPTSADLRRDLGTWWCTGVIGSGFVGLWVLAHPGYSQHYFWRIVIGLGIVLSLTMVVRQFPTNPRGAIPPVIAIVLAGIAVGVVFSLRDPLPFEPAPIDFTRFDVAGRLVPYGVAAACLIITLMVLHALAAGAGWVRVPFVALVACYALAIGTTSAAFDLNRMIHYRSTLTKLDPTNSRYISGNEQRAALWLNQHSGGEDVVATNVFCASTRYRPACRHLSFWVAGLTGRQLFVGAWAYTEKNLSEYGKGGTVDYQRISSPWPDRVSLSLTAVRSPDKEVVSQLAAKGVRWIFADRRAPRVSPLLTKFATLSYHNGDVLIYRLRSTKGTP